MKALFWQWMLITTLCLAAQCIAAPFDNSKYLQEKYFSPKRTKPSLSIVNPLDVLRQRVMLEMARRQRENANKQAEINKEILKSIGKRGNNIDYDDIETYLRNRYYDTSRLYAPLNYQTNEVRPDTISKTRNVIVPGQSTKPIEKNTNGNDKASSDTALNENLNQEQVYVIDDTNNNPNDDDDDTQMKYLYSLYKNRLSNNF